MKSACLPLLGALALASAWASDDYSYVGKPGSEVYFGHIGDCTLRQDGLDPKVVREGRDEPALPNMPLLAGDTIVTGAGRRCEALFDTGTVLRLDGGTRLSIETILAPALTAKAGLTNLALEQGRVYVLYRAYDRREVFQILTPNAAVKLRDSARATVDLGADGTTGIEAHRGWVEVLFGPAAENRSRRRVQDGRRFVVRPDDSAGRDSAPRATAADDFGTWNEALTEGLERERRGKSPVPKSLRHSPPAIVDFAERWSTTEGTWLQSDAYGAVWRPRDNDRSDWQPYREGRWVTVRDELFWVADERWGWVPYHLGYWTWLRGHGWVWVPGSMFAPAWVMWGFGATSVAWRPWDRWDFVAYTPEMTTWSSRHPSQPPQEPPDHAIPRPSPAPGSPPPPERPRPRPPREAVRGEVEPSKAPRAGDVARQEAMDVVRRSVVVVPWNQIAPTRAQRPEGVARASGGPESATGTPSLLSAPAAEAPVRFRDWNPDVEAARRAGGVITYSSQHNTVRCQSCQVPLTRGGGDSHSRDSWGSSSGGSSGGSDSGSDSRASGGSDGRDGSDRGGSDGSDRGGSDHGGREGPDRDPSGH